MGGGGILTVLCILIVSITQEWFDPLVMGSSWTLFQLRFVDQRSGHI